MAKKTKVVVQRIREKRKYDATAETIPDPIMFGFGLLPDGSRVFIETEGEVKVGGRYPAEKVIGQSRYKIKGRKRKKK
ncbi:MAG: hypothetical protein KAT43_01545 [Nanoarchaeota archaeon]|nr:hypothetical protein [Nanoarchaeota archaeon]